MYQLTPKQQQQYEWAVAWQDLGDRAALASLVASVRPLAYRIARPYAFDQTLYEDVLAECQLAAVEAANHFDRARPSGYVTLCGFFMRTAIQPLFIHRKTPASAPPRAKVEATRVAILTEPDPDVDGVVLVAEEEIRHDPGLRRVLCSLFDDAGLSARERSILEGRHLHGQSLGTMAAARECSTERVRQLEQSGLAKVREAAARRGLSLADIL